MTQDTAQLDLVLHLRREQERQAGEALRTAQSLLSEEEQRLAALEGYAEEYHGRQAIGPSDPRVLRDARLFLAQLEQTRQAQGHQVLRAREAVETARARWLSARVQREAIERLAGRRQDERRRGEARAEQRQQDELSLAARVVAGSVH
ncbi:MAG: flagellar export protein FliJ [Gammaproteobacteria bacterium]|nr:MAG: flagellar export protein FliJ [Gammaproteobacteria bacterium]